MCRRRPACTARAVSEHYLAAGAGAAAKGVVSHVARTVIGIEGIAQRLHGAVCKIEFHVAEGLLRAAIRAERLPRESARDNIPHRGGTRLAPRGDAAVADIDIETKANEIYTTLLGKEASTYYKDMTENGLAWKQLKIGEEL